MHSVSGNVKIHRYTSQALIPDFYQLGKTGRSGNGGGGGWEERKKKVGRCL